MLATALFLLTTAYAQEAFDTRNTLNVTGTGEVWVEPDEAVLTLGVRAQGDTAGAAFDAAAKKMATVNAALATSVSGERIRTSQLSLQPRYEHPARGAPRLVGYEASASLEIRVDEPTDTGIVLDAAVGAGANEVTGVAFRVEDEAAAREAALDAAVEDARKYATQVADRLGVTLGEPLTVTIRTEDRFSPPIMYERAADEDSAGVMMPVLAGEQIYRAQVDVRFTLEGSDAEPAPPPEEEPEQPIEGAESS